MMSKETNERLNRDTHQHGPLRTCQVFFVSKETMARTASIEQMLKDYMPKKRVRERGLENMRTRFAGQTITQREAERQRSLTQKQRERSFHREDVESQRTETVSDYEAVTSTSALVLSSSIALIHSASALRCVV